MTTVEFMKIEEAGSDFIRLRDGDRNVRITFTDDEMFSKEDSAGFFCGFQGKPAAIPIEGPFFIAVDFCRDIFDGSLRVIPFNFAVASVERYSLSRCRAC
jgi:hypothetical protein